METDEDADLEAVDADARWVVVKREVRSVTVFRSQRDEVCFQSIMRLDKNGRIVPCTNGDAINEAMDTPAPPPDVMHGKTPVGQVVKSRRRKAHNLEVLISSLHFFCSPHLCICVLH